MLFVLQKELLELAKSGEEDPVDMGAEQGFWALIVLFCTSEL